MVSNEQMPYPGDELAFRVQGIADRDTFHKSGSQSVEEFGSALKVLGRTWDSFENVLDFGCGSGRMMMWLEPYSKSTAFHGVDIDKRAVVWARQNLTFATFEVNEPLPPLPYPDGFFDLVINHSVFTHIDHNYQDQWLAELQRVTKPGALLILSVHGEHAFKEFERDFANAGGDSGAVRLQFEKHGIVFVEEDGWIGSFFPDFYHTTYHAPWYVQTHWADYFKIRDYLPQADLGLQDLVLLERAEQARKPGSEPSSSSSGSSATAAPMAPAPEEADPIAARLRHAQQLVSQGPVVESFSRAAVIARPARRLVLRALRHFSSHQRQVNDELIRSALATAAEQRAMRRSISVLKESLRQQGSRINRLESDLFATLEELKNSSGETGGEEPDG